jgi:Fur family peroxide stress response transcriptional regulator
MKALLVGEKRRTDYADGRMVEFAAHCRQKGLAVTPQRMAIIRALFSSAEHPSADRIYATVGREHPHMSLATVHRTLEKLVEIGEARKVTVLHDRARYEGNVTPHHHVVCVRCRRIRDIEIPGVEHLLKGRAVIGEFRVFGTSVEVLAICQACRGSPVRKTAKQRTKKTTRTAGER